jgi:UDP-N-acetylglucosamine 2-epimerase
MPVIRAFEHVGMKPKVFVTGQHRELLELILTELNIVHAENLRWMEPHFNRSYRHCRENERDDA